MKNLIFFQIGCWTLFSLSLGQILAQDNPVQKIDKKLNVELLRGARDLKNIPFQENQDWVFLKESLTADFYRDVFPKNNREKAWSLAQDEDFTLNPRSWWSKEMLSLLAKDARAKYSDVFKRIERMEKTAKTSQNPKRALARWRELFMLQFFSAAPDLIPKKRPWDLRAIASIIYDSNLLLQDDDLAPAPVSDKRDFQSLALVHWHKQMASDNPWLPQAWSAQVLGLMHEEHDELDLTELSLKPLWGGKSSWVDAWWLGLNTDTLFRAESVAKQSWSLYSSEQSLRTGASIDGQPLFFKDSYLTTILEFELGYRSHFDNLLTKRNGSQVLAGLEFIWSDVFKTLKRLSLSVDRKLYHARESTFDSETTQFNLSAEFNAGKWLDRELNVRPSINHFRRIFPHINGDELVEDLSSTSVNFNYKINEIIELDFLIAQKWKRDEMKTQLLGNQKESNNKNVLQLSLNYLLP